MVLVVVVVVVLLLLLLFKLDLINIDIGSDKLQEEGIQTVVRCNSISQPIQNLVSKLYVDLSIYLRWRRYHFSFRRNFISVGLKHEISVKIRMISAPL